MRVLHVSETVQGGIATVLNQLASYSNKKEFEFFLVCPENQSVHICTDSFINTFLFNRTGRNFKSIFYFIIFFVKALISTKPDIVHLHSSFAGAFGRFILMIIRPFYRPVVIYTPHGWSFIMNVSRFRLRFFSLLERFFLLVTDRVICVSNYEKNRALEFGFPNENIVVIHNGCDYDVNFSVPEFYPFKKNKFNILFVGRFDYSKGYDIALKVISKLPSETYHLTIVGDSVIDDKCSWLSSDNVTHAGWLTACDLIPYYKNADLLLMPSRWEAFGLVAIEAQSFFLPVLASNCCSLPEVVSHGYSGYLFKVGDASEAANFILNTKSEVWDTFKINARKYYESNFSSHIMCSKTFDLYITLAKRV